MRTEEHTFSIDVVRRRDQMVAAIHGNTRARLDEYAQSRGLLCSLPVLAGDLVRIGLAVYSADRLARRDWRNGSGGFREIQLDVGVVEPDFWREPSTIRLLRDALGLVGDDDWEFRFHEQRPDADYLSWRREERPRICLYSGGLDSFAGLATRLGACREPVLPVTAYHQGGQKERVSDQARRLASRYSVKLYPIVVRLALKNPPPLRYQELNQRCRSFMFTALGGAVACAGGSSEVEVYENGVGAINLPPMHGMATGAYMTKSSHPRFLRLMSELVTRVAGRPLDFALPHRTSTKAEVTRALIEDGLVDVACSTVSCVHYPVRGKAKQCGYCPACIGRRQAMITAGIVEPVGAYEYDLFGTSQVTNAIPLEKLNYLKATLMQVDRLGELERRPMPEWFLGYMLGTGVEDNTAALEPWVQVLLRYRKEWLDLVALGQSRGWNWARWLPVSSAA